MNAFEQASRVILSLNDYAPSGSLMMADIIQRARHYAPEASFHCEQVALTREQVTRYRLPTRPTKMEGNTHAKLFNDADSVELDALDPDDLRGLLKDAIERHIDHDVLAVMKEAEASEQRTLIEMARGVPA